MSDMDAYAALDDTLFVVRDIQDAPQVNECLTEHQFECLTATPDGSVFAGTVESGLLRSSDGGETWTEVGDFDDRVTAVTISPHDPTVVWVGTEPSGVYTSTDGGETWTHLDGLTDLPSADRWSFPPRPQKHHVRWLAVNPQDPETVYIAIEAGAFVRTTDGGETWEPHPEGARRDNHTLATHPDAPGRVYTAAGDGYAQSEDGGKTWAYPQDGLEHRYVWGLAVDAGDPETVVVSAASGARSAHTPETAESYVYRTTDGGWERAMDGLPDASGTVRALLDSGPDSGEFVALTNRGLFYTDNGATSWQHLDIEWPDEYERQVGRGFAVV
jgi:photosystem II stability/assembly factor-like uncharacterized protein